MAGSWREWLSGSRFRKSIIVLSVLAVMLLAATPAVFAYTEAPSFCNTCHEMRPYYDAWASGTAHKDVACTTCHVKAGIVNRFLHKFVALKEVADHFRGDTSFPRKDVELPPGACSQCHDKLPAKTAAGFQHSLHSKIACRRCHPSAGHEVSYEALASAGILAPGYPATGTPQPWRFAVARNNLAGHAEVVCARCHDLASTKCSQCHRPPAKNHAFPGDCSQCHRPGAAWRFEHPAVVSGCGKCHKPPAKNHAFTAPCVQCHVTGVTWKFKHPASRSDCVKCHKPPANNHAFGGACVQCHVAGVSWKFVHPKRSDCASCHKPPANHFGPNCSSCHSPGVAFKNARFAHPGNTGEHSWRSFPCVKCHPNGYATASCTCHGGRPPSGD